MLLDMLFFCLNYSVLALKVADADAVIITDFDYYCQFLDSNCEL